MKFANFVLALAACVMLGCSKSADLFVWNRPILAGSHLPLAQSATCRFKKSLAVSFQKVVTKEEPNSPERIYYSAGDENESDTVSFLDLDTKTPKVQSNGGQASLSVVNDDGQTLTLLNIQPGSSTAEMYTIFRNTGIVIHSQQKNSLFIGPFGVIEMGYCN